MTTCVWKPTDGKSSDGYVCHHSLKTILNHQRLRKWHNADGEEIPSLSLNSLQFLYEMHFVHVDSAFFHIIPLWTLLIATFSLVRMMPLAISLEVASAHWPDRMFQSFNKKLRLITPPCLNPHSMLRFSLPCHALNQCEVLKPAWGVTNYPTWLKLLYTTSVAKSKFGNQITAIHSKDTLPTYG